MIDPLQTGLEEDFEGITSARRRAYWSIEGRESEIWRWLFGERWELIVNVTSTERNNE